MSVCQRGTEWKSEPQKEKTALICILMISVGAKMGCVCIPLIFQCWTVLGGVKAWNVAPLISAREREKEKEQQHRHSTILHPYNFRAIIGTTSKVFSLVCQDPQSLPNFKLT